jgi:RHS repeat-associated protein
MVDGFVQNVEHVVGQAVDAGAHLVGAGLDAVGLHDAAKAVDNAGDEASDYLGNQIAEKQLGESDDPTQLVHGDTQKLTDAAGHLTKFATAFSKTAHGLSVVDSDHWKGAAADAFREKFAPHPKQWADAQQACGDAARALSSFADTVKWAQEQARQAIALYKKGQDATARAQQQYNSAVDAYNRQVDSYNNALTQGQQPGAAPTKPAAFTDPGQADREQAKGMLDRARAQRDSAGQQAQSAISAATGLAPAEPSFAQRLLDDASDTMTSTTIAAAHVGGGIIKGAGGIVKFVRGLDPLDPYNLTHPAEYVDGVSTTIAGLAHTVNHPDDLVKGLAGTGWDSDPAEALGKLLPNVALAVGTDGAGTAADAAASLGERAAVDAGETAGRSVARDAAGDAGDIARSPEDMTCAADPIDVATGHMVLPQRDVDLPGVLPLVVERTHNSGYRLGRWFGPSWASTVDQRLVVDGEGVLYTGPDGVVLLYPHPTPGATVLPELGARLPLSRTEDGYTITDPTTGRTLHFARRIAESWPLTAVTDRVGHRITIHYDPDGVPAEIHHTGGYHIQISTTDDRITALHLGEVELMRYSYTDGHLTEVINSSEQALRFRYDQAGRITEWVDRNDCWYRYTYDGQGRCVRAEGADGFLDATFCYERENRVTTHTDGLGAVTTYQLDEFFHVIGETDPLGNTTRMEIDRLGRPLARTDPLGRTTSYTYDEAGNPTSVTRPDGTQALAEYNELRLPITRVDPDGAVWRYDYSERGQCVATTDPAGNTTRYDYDERGHIAAVTDALGNITGVETDDTGLPTSITDPLGAVVRYTRDDLGRVAEQTDPVGGVTRYGWTVDGKPAWRTLPDGATERWTYDGEGNLVEHLDAVGQVTTMTYTGFDLLASRTGPDGARLEYAYDAELRLASVTNPQGLVWRYDYDLAGRLVRETDFNGHVLRYGYDPAGQLVERINGLGQATHYRRDLLGNLVEEHCGDQVATFDYDPVGRLVHATNADADLSIQHDVLGQIITETVNGRTLTNHYDPLGRRVHRRTPSGAESFWRFDAVGNPLAVQTGQRTIVFEHDAAGREIERRLGASVRLSQAWDANHRLLSQTLVGGELRQRAVQRRGYQYRADGLLVGIDDQLGGARQFELDGVGRVTAVHGKRGSEHYRYDDAGNITHAGWPGSVDVDVLGQRDYTGTLITRAGKTRYRHDSQGRVVLRQQKRLSTRDWVWRYSWDSDDRLVGVITPDGTAWRYRYDPLGRRIAKQRLALDGVTVIEQIDFTWDGDTLAEQVHNGVHATTWDWAPDGLRAISQTERAWTQEWVDQQFYAIVTDLVGTPTELVDAGGNLTWRQPTTLWGAALAWLGNRAHTPLRFPGQYFDPETGLHYNRHRYYDPATARYTSQDPLGLIPAPNPTTYVHNPLSWSDPLGLMGCDIHVSPAYQDWGTKGAHLHIDGKEVRIFPDGQGGIGADGIRLSNGTPTPKQVQQVLDAVKSDPSLRADLIQKARSAMDDMNAGSYGMSKNRAAEMNFLIKALEKMG